MPFTLVSLLFLLLALDDSWSLDTRWHHGIPTHPTLIEASCQEGTASAARAFFKKLVTRKEGSVLRVAGTGHGYRKIWEGRVVSWHFVTPPSFFWLSARNWNKIESNRFKLVLHFLSLSHMVAPPWRKKVPSNETKAWMQRLDPEWERSATWMRRLHGFNGFSLLINPWASADPQPRSQSRGSCRLTEHIQKPATTADFCHWSIPQLKPEVPWSLKLITRELKSAAISKLQALHARYSMSQGHHVKWCYGCYGNVSSTITIYIYISL